MHKKPGYLRWVRIAWTLLTFPFVIVAALIGGLVGVVAGLIGGSLTRRGPWYGLRAGLVGGALRGMRWIFSASSWVHGKLFFRPLHAMERRHFPGPVSEFLVVAHRGAAADECENTIAAFARALRQGANALEIDICYTRDGHLVLWHDWNPNDAVALYRESGLEDDQACYPVFPGNQFRRPVPDLTLDELRTHFGFRTRAGKVLDTSRKKHAILTAPEFLAWANKRLNLKYVFFDLKIPADQPQWVEKVVPALMKTLAASGLRFTPVLLSPWPPVFEAIARQDTGLPLCFDREVHSVVPGAGHEDARAHSTVREAERYGTSFASVGRPTFLTLSPFEVFESIILHDIRYRDQHNLDIRLIAWTINDRDEMYELVALGVDGILTDRPGVLANKVLRRKVREAVASSKAMLRLRSEKRKENE